jgi:hypothetical protein
MSRYSCTVLSTTIPAARTGIRGYSLKGHVRLCAITNQSSLSDCVCKSPQPHPTNKPCASSSINPTANGVFRLQQCFPVLRAQSLDPPRRGRNPHSRRRITRMQDQPRPRLRPHLNHQERHHSRLEPLGPRSNHSHTPRGNKPLDRLPRKRKHRRERPNVRRPHGPPMDQRRVCRQASAYEFCARPHLHAVWGKSAYYHDALGQVESGYPYRAALYGLVAFRRGTRWVSGHHSRSGCLGHV